MSPDSEIDASVVNPADSVIRAEDDRCARDNSPGRGKWRNRGDRAERARSGQPMKSPGEAA
jgi:hypothetical protein